MKSDFISKKFFFFDLFLFFIIYSFIKLSALDSFFLFLIKGFIFIFHDCFLFLLFQAASLPPAPLPKGGPIAVKKAPQVPRRQEKHEPAEEKVMVISHFFIFTFIYIFVVTPCYRIH